jgi:hypothetical protein
MDCITKRQAAAAPEAYKLVYAELKFIPLRYIRYINYKAEPIMVLDAIRNLRANNAYVRIPVRTYFCRWCGTKHEARNMQMHNGHRYCMNCINGTFVCGECGERHPETKAKNKGSFDGTYSLICYDCAAKLDKCDSCSQYYAPENTIKVAPDRDEIGNFNIHTMCSNCQAEQRCICTNCGVLTYASIATELRGHYYCPVCTEEFAGIQTYSYKPLRPRFQKAPTEGKVTKAAFHMGFELECAPHHSFIPNEAMVHLVKEEVGRDKIYMMEDGSIGQASGERGMEIASHPFTWEFYKKHGYKDWDKMCLFLRKHGWKASYKGLGIHIHTTKAAWGTHQIYKLFKFIHDNEVFIQRIAQRGQNMYCSYENLGPNVRKAVAKSKVQLDEHHYNVINLTNGESGLPSKTIEFRMFQSTFEPLYFHKNIEFTYACYQFTRSEKEMTEQKFKSFLHRHRRDFPCLYDFLNLSRQINRGGA